MNFLIIPAGLLLLFWIWLEDDTRKWNKEMKERHKRWIKEWGEEEYLRCGEGLKGGKDPYNLCYEEKKLR